MKIVVLDGYTLNPADLSWKSLGELGDLTVYDRIPAEKIVERIGDAEIVFTNKTPLSRDTLTKIRHLKYVGVLATGYNVVDVKTAREKGIVVTNIPTYGTSAVAQMTFAMLLEMCHHVWAHSEEVKKGMWSSCPDFCFWNYPLIELAGKTMGIVGFGRIGRAVAEIAKAFGMEVLAFDPCKPEGNQKNTVKYVELEELLEKSDVISLHCPLNDGTKGIINIKTISVMKSSVLLINTSRGPLIEEKDLADALNSGKIAGAALDVLAEEPVKPDNPLLTAQNCIITPHIAWALNESRKRLMDMAVGNLASYLAGKPVNLVL